MSEEIEKLQRLIYDILISLRLKQLDRDKNALEIITLRQIVDKIEQHEDSV